MAPTSTSQQPGSARTPRKPVQAFLGTRATQAPTMPSDAVYVILRGSGKATFRVGEDCVSLGREKSRILVCLLLRSALGMTTGWRELVEMTHGDDPTGGPEYAAGVMRVRLRAIRAAISPLGLGIIAPGWNGYRVIQITPQVYIPAPYPYNLRASYG